MVSEWDFLYNKAHNEYLNFLATTGAVCLGSYLLLIGWIIVWWVKVFRPTSHVPPPSSFLLIALLSGYVSILITNFFGFSVVSVAIFFFLYPAFMVVLLRKDEEAPSPKSNKDVNPAQYLGVAIILLAMGYLIFNLARLWQADVAYSTGNKLDRQGEYPKAFDSLREAIQLNSGEPNYWDETAWDGANLAMMLNLQKETGVEKLVAFAIFASDKALTISPRNLNFYKTRTKVFFNLAQIDPKYLSNALDALLTARKLAPTDAKIAYNLGLLQEQIGQRDEAIKTLEETVRLKSNYPDAHYALAMVYKNDGRIADAIAQLEYIKNNITPEFMETSQKLKEWKQ